MDIEKSIMKNGTDDQNIIIDNLFTLTEIFLDMFSIYN